MPLIAGYNEVPYGFSRVIFFDKCEMCFLIPLPLRWKQHSYQLRREAWGNLHMKYTTVEGFAFYWRECQNIDY